MKLISGTFLFLLTFWFGNTARSQLISFSVNKEPLEKVFLLIEKQSGYNFIYSAEMLAKTSPVTLTVSNQSIEPVLIKCFAGQPLQYAMDEKHILVKEKKQEAVARPLSGKVMNEEGEPVPGVTVAVRNAALQTATDAMGAFHFTDVKINAVLHVSGAEIIPLEVNTGSDAFVLVVARKKLGLLDETIVIAYGKTTRRTAVGSVAKVSREEIERQPVSNFLGAMAGRVTGMQITQGSGLPGSPFQIRLRGQNSIANGNDPLYVIDGIPFPSTPMGSIMTGSELQTPLNWINISDIESIEVLKDAEATAIYGSRGANGVVLITTRRGAAGKLTVTAKVQAGAGRVTRFIDLLETPEYLQMRREAFANDGATPTIDNARDLLVYDSTKNTNWQKVLIGRTMHQFDTRVEMSGGSAQTQFLAGINYHKESTVVPIKEFGEEKTGGQFSLQHHTVDQRISFSLQSSLMRTKLLAPESSPVGNVKLPPNMPDPRNPDGSLYWDPYWGNALQQLLRPSRTTSDNFLTSATLTVKIVPGLEAKVSFGYNWIALQETSHIPGSSWNPIFNAPSSATFGNSSLQNIISEPQLTYSQKWRKLSATILAGASLQNNRQRGLLQTGTGYTSEELLNSLQAASNVTTNSESSIRYRYAGFFARTVFNWDSKYLFSLTARRDGSSRYAPANRFSNFGSVGAGWIFTREHLMKNVKWLSFGKLRATLGTSGNDQIGDYQYLDTYSPYLYSYQGTVTFEPLQLFSSSYNWEKVSKRELALDLGLWKDRMLVTVNYYNNETLNQLVSYGLPSTTGFSGILRNLPAKVSNYGWEFELTAVPVLRKEFEWSVSFNVTVPRNRLVRFDNIASSSYANTYVVGKPLLITKRYELIDVNPETGLYRFRDFNGDGQYTRLDRQSIVFTGQQFFGGMQQNFKWKKVTAGFLLQFVHQSHAGNYLNAFDMPGTLANQPSLVLGRWQKPGDITSIQKFSTGSGGSFTTFNRLISSDGSYDDASFLRLKNLYVSWQLKRYATLLVTGQNLFTITKFSNLDPETRSFLPPLRVITAGVQIKL
ncbi:MAG: SusC/RagA family TonB-linked outer membrane protein [Chitinophagaceae bacterium]